MPKTSPAPRVPAVPPREPPLEPRPAGTVPECVPPQRHALGEDSPADGNVSRAGDECGGVGVGTKRRFDEARLAGAPHESVQTCHTPLASEVGRRPWRDPQEMPHPSRTYTPPMRRGRDLIGRAGGQGRRAGGRGLSQLLLPSPSYCNAFARNQEIYCERQASASERPGNRYALQYLYTILRSR